MKAIKQTPQPVIQESNRTLVMSGAAYSILFGAWLLLQLTK